MVAEDHDHVGHMVWESGSAWCDVCGRTWWLKVYQDKVGKPMNKWIPEQPYICRPADGAE
jgi:hypothetical protein